MGLALEFYAGDPTIIGQAVRDLDLDKLDDPANFQAKADFSLHLQPKDLDILSVQVAELIGREPVLLSENLESVMYDEPDRGALIVGEPWISQLAAMPVDRSHELTARWIAAMVDTYSDPGIRMTPEAQTAVSDLLKLCHYANEHSTPVIHVWFL